MYTRIGPADLTPLLWASTSNEEAKKKENKVRKRRSKERHQNKVPLTDGWRTF